MDWNVVVQDGANIPLGYQVWSNDGRCTHYIDWNLGGLVLTLYSTTSQFRITYNIKLKNTMEWTAEIRARSLESYNAQISFGAFNQNVTPGNSWPSKKFNSTSESYKPLTKFGLFYGTYDWVSPMVLFTCGSNQYTWSKKILIQKYTLVHN